MTQPRIKRTLTIANADSVSDALDLTDTNLLGLIMPAAWTSAALTLEVSPDGSSWYPAYDAVGSQTGFIASPVVSAAYAVDLSALLAWRYVRLRSGTTATPVTQGAARPIIAITRELA